MAKTVPWGQFPRRLEVGQASPTEGQTIMKRSTSTAVSGLALVALLTGCTPSVDDADEPTSSPTTDVAASPEAPSTPRATPSPTPVARPASIPTDCTDLVDAATYAQTMGNAPLNDPAYFERQMGQVTPTAPPIGADLRQVVSAGDVLRCGWADIQADITGLFAQISTVDAATAAAYPGWLAEKREPTSPSWLDGVAYDCSEAHGGSLCQYVTTHPMYGVEMADTVLVRDGVVVTVTQRNVPTDDLMGSIVTRLWG